ncbi:DUF58 domain-containing protein [Stratiformator vulcanicus]|uniref:DUF58 domain-containing protein n=1 Tax=Stratiformator vulcanicus TaxID=2527980 RepID=A0A517QYM3_9PLAN|nr:DUF58 domain-containing protein [Stratiformator vulcanicus]QDT36756.1 hypothetical protein Pan189_11190 [Stratiformator vulcanicus]
MMPRLRLIGLVAAAALLAVPAIWYPAFAAAATVANGVIALVAIYDLWSSPHPRHVVPRRQLRDVLSVGVRNPIRIRLRNRNEQAILIEIHEEPPAGSTIDDLPARLELDAGQTRTILYHIVPEYRGRGEFGRMFLRSVSRLGLWTLTATRIEPRQVRIYPDIRSVQKAELLARQNRLAEAGVRMSKLRGRGSEFDRLREYRREDEYRDIDWKATARKQELVSREYQVEKNQNVIILLDAGRGMCNVSGGVRHFDRALNAAVLLAYVAARQGDTVAMLACSNKVERWVPSLRGTTAVERLVQRAYDLEAAYVATDYDLLAKEVRRRQPKRSLAVLITHALDDVHLSSMTGPIRRLKSPHLALAAFVKNEPLEARAHAIPTTDLDAFQVASASALFRSQQLGVRKLEQSGILAVQASPEDLAGRIINQYLEIKARHLL